MTPEEALAAVRGIRHPRMDGHCDVCGKKLPKKGVAWMGEETARWFYCPKHWPSNIRASHRAMIEEASKQ